MTSVHDDGVRASAPHRTGMLAAVRAIERNTLHVELPWGLGSMALPSPDHMAWYAGIAVIAAFGLIDWPVAAVLGLGHLLAEDHHHRLLRDFGQALEEA